MVFDCVMVKLTRKESVEEIKPIEKKAGYELVVL